MGKPQARDTADELRVAVGSLVRRVKQVYTGDGDLSYPEITALSRLDREGPSTSADLAKREHITPQSMGTTLAALEARGLVARRPDPNDGRRAVISLTRSGREAVLQRRGKSTDVIARALDANFTPAEMTQLRAAAALIERLANVL